MVLFDLEFPFEELLSATPVTFLSDYFEISQVFLLWYEAVHVLFDLDGITLHLVLVPCGGGRTSPRTSP